MLSELQQCSTGEITSYAGEKDGQNRICEMDEKLAEEDIRDNVESRFIRLERHCWWSSPCFLKHLSSIALIQFF